MRADQRDGCLQVNGQDFPFVSLGNRIVRFAVEDAGVIDQRMDFAE